MIFRTFIAPVFAAMTALQPAIATQQVPPGFQYINDSDDGDLYFIKQVARSGDVAFAQIFIIEPNGETGTFVHEFNCKTNQYRKRTTKTWVPINPKTVGTDWAKFACN